MFSRCRSIAFALLLIVVSGLPAFAGPFQDSVAKFANHSFSDTQDAVGEIPTSGNPRPFDIISALNDERLYADPESKKVFIKGTDDKIVDATTGAAVSDMPSSALAAGSAPD